MRTASPGRGLIRTACLVLLVIAALLSPLRPGKAQDEDPGAAAAPGRPALEKLVQTLEDPQAREALVKQLKALIEAQESLTGEAQPAESEGFGARLLAALSQRIDVIAKQLSAATGALAELPEALAGVWRESKDPETLSRWAEIVSKIILVLLCGLVAEWLTRRALARPRRAVEERARERLLLRLLFLLVRTGLDVLPIGAFALAAYLVLPLTDPRPATRLVALALVNANVLVAVVLAAGRMLFSPRVPNLRLFAVGNETATYLYIWVRRLAAIGVYGYFFAEAGLLLGLPPGAHAVLIKTIGFVVTAMAVVLVLQNRTNVRDWLRGPYRRDGEGAPGAGGRRTLRSIAEWTGAVWHVAAIGLTVALYGTWALEIPHGFQFLIRGIVLTAIVGAVAWGMGRAIDAAVARGSRIPADLKDKFPRLEERVNRYLPLLREVFKGLVYALAGLIILEFWGIGALAWLGSEAGQNLISRIATILLLAGSALVIWELVSALIERALARHAAEDGGLQSPRVLTLLPLCRNIVRIVLVVMVTLIALSELGIDIGPLIAGAGVVGLAVGFGAQTLVKDVITGSFILMENSLAVGDWVELGSHSGTVEAMTIRTVRLRDLQGTVHVIPFGEVTSVLNYNRDFGFTLVDIGVAYREDVDEVFKVLEAVGEDLQADETYGPAILEPLQVMGLNNLGESSVDIRVRLKTKAMMQWSVRRELLRRTKKAFDARGIEIPFPHRTLYFGVDRDGTAPPAHIVQDTAQ
ncbi:MAG TPA: mechanosensitive ion channel domain-containing protein [Kiloniellales bacterium]